jgi:TRAP-type C4-dicarboxylate transport system substrate-binding protein
MIASSLTRRSGLIAAVLVALLAAWPGSEALAQAKSVRLSFHWGVDHESAIMATKFADEVNKAAAGQFKIDVFPSGQLFSIRQISGALSAGSVEIGGVVTHNQFSAIDNDWNMVQIPGIWRGIEHQRDFFSKTPEGKALRERILKKANLVHLAYVPVGPYVTFSKSNDMSTVEKMRGLKARSLAASERPGFAARKMSVVSLSTEEVYTALQSGMIDTLSTVPTAVKAYAWWDHLKTAQLPYAVYADSELMANGTWFNSLPANVQKIMLEVGARISKEATDRTMAGNAAALKEMVEKHGGKITTLTGPALEAFDKLDREQTQPALAKMMSKEIFDAAIRFTSTGK